MSKKAPRRVLIMGAAGRDFHNFNVCFRDDPSTRVVAFTAAQIPFIHDRTYPPKLAGKLYPKGIPVYPEQRTEELIRTLKVDAAVFAYSDVAHVDVMHKASTVMAAGADFLLLGPRSTQLKSKLPVISVCAVRTGCGKSPVTKKVLGLLKELGKNPAAIRHPMPYCDLERQRAQRFSSHAEMDEQSCTIEEREEYEPIVDAGFSVYAGVDYAEVLRLAENDADVIVWDGGNNDFPFIRPDLDIVVADALRPGHGLMYHPGEVNLRRADVVVVNKVSAASKDGLAEIRRAVRRVNQDARIITASSPVEIQPAPGTKGVELEGKKVLVVEDGPTLTHGGMGYGAGVVAAREAGALVVDPRPHAKGSIKRALKEYPHVSEALPAMGYSEAQLKDLAATIKATPCDAVLFATPVNLTRLVKISRPAFRVTYRVKETGGLTLKKLVSEFVEGRG